MPFQRLRRGSSIRERNIPSERRHGICSYNSKVLHEEQRTGTLWNTTKSNCYKFELPPSLSEYKYDPPPRLCFADERVSGCRMGNVTVSAEAIAHKFDSLKNELVSCLAENILDETAGWLEKNKKRFLGVKDTNVCVVGQNIQFSFEEICWYIEACFLHLGHNYKDRRVQEREQRLFGSNKRTHNATQIGGCMHTRTTCYCSNQDKQPLEMRFLLVSPNP